VFATFKGEHRMSIEHGPARDRMAPQFRPLSVTVETACALSGLGRTTIYALAKQNRLRIVKVGARSLIPYADLEKLVAGEAA